MQECNGKRSILSSAYLLFDPELCMRRKDDRHGPFCRVFSGLIGMFAPPSLDTRAIAFDRRSPRPPCGFESLQNRACGRVTCRIDSRYTPNHRSLPKHRQGLHRHFTMAGAEHLTTRRGSERNLCLDLTAIALSCRRTKVSIKCFTFDVVNLRGRMGATLTKAADSADRSSPASIEKPSIRSRQRAPRPGC
jgi:hypothetical protein